jgi:hypothetical protein
MNLITDQTLTWQGFGNGFEKWHSQCRLRIFQAEMRSFTNSNEVGEASSGREQGMCAFCCCLCPFRATNSIIRAMLLLRSG